MSVNKTAMALALQATVILTGCSTTARNPLEIDGSGGKSGVIDASINRGNSKNANHLTTLNEGIAQELQAEEAQINVNAVDTALAKQTIYFMYDSSEVEPGFMAVIEKQSQELVKNPAQTLVLEGHTDERGSREYNIALGEQRAKAVAQIMQAHGVHSNQLEIVSYGEEKPVAVEHNETAWHFNRRVNLISLRIQK
jgi:peptidoglycan-associated lipoprotein